MYRFIYVYIYIYIYTHIYIYIYYRSFGGLLNLRSRSRRGEIDDPRTNLGDIGSKLSEI
jgi:hypothetical protein